MSRGIPLRAATLQTLATFTNVSTNTNGSRANNGLVADAAGNLYGTTAGGGPGSYGVVFKIAAGTHDFTPLTSFDGNMGGIPNQLIIDSSGTLYGTTSFGINSAGTIFKIATQTGVATNIAGFDDFATGGTPQSPLTPDGTGGFYGTTTGGGHTAQGGTAYGGTVFHASANGTVTQLALFDDIGGRLAYSGLTRGPTGIFYGTTRGGGFDENGLVYAFNPVTNSLTTIAAFDGSQGADPEAGITIDAAGHLYGTTVEGGTGGSGTLYQVLSNKSIKTLVNFNGTNGSEPVGTMIVDANGNLFGTTDIGGVNNASGTLGSNDGTVFEFNPATNVLTTLWSFSGLDGAGPTGMLLADAAGNLYGTTSGGGPDGGGTVFELTNTGFAVPEPGALGLAAVGLIALRRQR